ncbi:cobalt ECF transporter T component CbiQ [Arsenicicoccus piscis]|uniref:cobalt ECF transporter T component CbiQ n=1 Tax=Arsenicicoccus piscis TaxID=673954 RepID=UPI001F4D1470|nr:cobalt ECF transporter T component CbiQ [Arsenicicoccus piscis]MCH8626469.1 cobalt ECF transporter T component CbiQ [Arsenicicoccus piscis]
MTLVVGPPSHAGAQGGAGEGSGTLASGHLPGHAHGHVGLGAPEEGLLVIRDTVVHRLPAQVKLVAVVAFVLVVVATPTGRWGAFAVYALLLAGVVAVAHVPARLVLRRMLIEVPFVVFAAVLPFVASGPRVEVLGVSVSATGLVAGATMLLKATLGVVAAIVLAATTAPREMLAGLERLRLPALLVAMLSFMIRYLAVVTGDLHRMRVARESRGDTGGRVGQAAAVAGTAGSLFVRSYERGERVHQAMLARGYAGHLPALVSGRAARAREWALAASLPVATLVTLVLFVSVVPR